MDEINYCQNCGKKLDGVTVFCPRCGKKINEKTETPAPTSNESRAGLIVANIFIPGLGHIIDGRISKGIILLFSYIILAVFGILLAIFTFGFSLSPAIVVWIYSLYDINSPDTLTQNNNILVTVLVIILVICTLVLTAASGNISSSSNLIVENVTVSNDMFGQKFTADILPDKDYDYLGAKIIYYDANGAIINDYNLLWNMLDVHKGQPIKMQGDSYSYEYAGNPAFAKILFFDSALSQNEEDALFTYTVNYK